MNTMNGMAAAAADEAGEAALAALAGVLEPLWRAHLQAPEQPISLAKLSKQSQRRMSVLMRQSTFMEQAGWVEPVAPARGGEAVRLTAAGALMCAGLFGGADPIGRP